MAKERSYKAIQDVTNVYTDSAQMVRFRLNNGWDYVWVTYNDLKGLISISSSFGNFAYIWNSRGEGVSLREFFIEASSTDYLANKFFSEDTKKATVFEYSIAIAEIKKLIIDDRKARKISKEEARDLLEELEGMGSDYESEEMFYRAFFDSKELSEWQPEIYEYTPGRVRSEKYLVLKDEIIPMIQKHFKKELEKEAIHKAKGKYRAEIAWSEEDRVYVARAPELAGVVTHGNTLPEAASALEEAITLHLESLNKHEETTETKL